MQQYGLGPAQPKQHLCRKGSEGPGGRHIECASQQARCALVCIEGHDLFYLSPQRWWGCSWSPVSGTPKIPITWSESRRRGGWSAWSIAVVNSLTGGCSKDGSQALRMRVKLPQISGTEIGTRYKEKRFFPEGVKHGGRLGVPIPGDTQSLTENGPGLTLELVSPVLRRVGWMASSRLFQPKLFRDSLLFCRCSQAVLISGPWSSRETKLPDCHLEQREEEGIFRSHPASLISWGCQT